MFMLLGYSPELTQAAYRIGDSTSNVIAPMMSYFALIVAFFERYDKTSGIGTVVATMLPYTVVFLACWSVMLVIWMLLGLPVGPVGRAVSVAPASPRRGGRASANLNQIADPTSASRARPA